MGKTLTPGNSSRRSFLDRRGTTDQIARCTGDTDVVVHSGARNPLLIRRVRGLTALMGQGMADCN
jgi:hypothetical protein